MNPTVREIVYMYLVRYEYDGLYNDEVKCSCLKDDLFPCECFHARNCRAGYYNEPLGEDEDIWIGSKKEM